MRIHLCWMSHLSLTLWFSHDPAYTDDSEVVVLEGAVGSGERSIEFGESFGDIEDWDIISFAGLDSGVNLDLSQIINSDYEAVATNSTAQTVAYIRRAEGVFGTSIRIRLQGMVP